MLLFQDYDIKLLLAFGEAVRGKKEFSDLLLEHGYPELAALTNAIHSDQNALHWLLQSPRYAHLGVLSNAIDGEDDAYKWLNKNQMHFYIVFADACRKKEKALKWLGDQNLKVFLRLAQIINGELEQQRKDLYNPHKIFRR
jgi:hypothetical protein